MDEPIDWNVDWKDQAGGRFILIGPDGIAHQVHDAVLKEALELHEMPERSDLWVGCARGRHGPECIMNIKRYLIEHM